MKYLKSLLAVVLVAAMISCDVEDSDLPIPLEETMNNNGAILRVLSVEVGALDLAEPDNAAYTIVGEYFDGEGATLLDNVTFEARYTSFFIDAADEVNIPDEGTLPVKTIPASAFSPGGDDGLPRATVSVSLTELLDGLGMELSDIGVEDVFNIQWTVNLTDGRSFGPNDASPDVTGGGFFRAPGQANVQTVQALDNDEFVGLYRFEQRAGGVFGWWAFSETFETELSVDPDNTLNGRVFTFEPYADDWGGLAPLTMPITIGRTAQFNTGSSGIGTGLGCSSTLALGNLVDSNNLVEIDVTDDSEFVLVGADNVQLDCDAPPVDIAFDVTKVE